MISSQHKKPLTFAIVLHALLFCVLIFSISHQQFRTDSSAPKNIIHAKAIILSSADADKTPKIQPKATPEKTADDDQKIKAEQLAKAKAEKVAQQKQLALLAAKQAKIQAAKKAELKKEKALAAAKAAQLKKQQLMAEKKAKDKTHEQKLLAEQKKLQQQLLEQQMQSEAKNISAIQTQAKQQAEIDQYKAQILAVIQSNWRIPELNQKLKCIYSVAVAPDGSVLSIKLMQSSGNDALDQSAEQAIKLASPLPVPTDPTLFSHFRNLMLTLSPQGYLQSVA